MSRWLPVPASLHAHAMDAELTLVHAVIAALFVGWALYFAWVLVRFRRARQPVPADRPARGRAALWVTGAVVVFEAVMLVGLALPLSANLRAVPPAREGATVVRVVAQQFQWNVHYPGADGEFGQSRAELISGENPVGLDRASPYGADDIVTGFLHVPVGRVVIVQLTSKDVVHSFGLPNFRVKQDAIPGTVATVWFTPTLEGQFDIACSQLCGLGHYRMRGLVIVESAAAYGQFLADETALLK